MSTVLIIDDEPGIRTVLSDILEDEKYSVITAADGIEGLAILKKEPVDLVILDIWLPNMGGIDVLKEIKSDFPEIEVVMISGHANIDLAVKAVKLGAFDFIEKPLSLDKLLNIVRNALRLDSLRKENRNLRNSLLHEDMMIGNCTEMQEIRERIEQSAASNARVLITGGNGTGKELVAREIHEKSKRAQGPFIEVNCAAIPDTLIESELFGHEKGAFTSAVARRKGKFELAHKGTLFLDEVADMSLSAQAKVLRAIQEMKFERVGGEQSIEVDVRIIAATNRDIKHEIKNGKFREDLFFRLNVVPIHVPLLKDRRDDLPLLLDYFIDKFKVADKEKMRISPRAMKVLRAWSWPGNIRELKNFVERLTIMSDEEDISAEVAQYFLGENKGGNESPELNEYENLSLNDAKNAFERKLLVYKLEQSDYNISRTAEVLGIYPSNLHGKIKKFGIEMRK
ncbi:MAG: sigma-54-dependent Fis family transcriptional regulator [Spirochaetales bacterium]|nr:sigma-54-dependent Fis family transcriptional regulator [Spirochaetales bacterium]